VTGPFSQLSSALGSLTWTEPAPQQAIASLLSAESAILALSPSNLCADARQLAGHPRRVAPGTVAFLNAYLDASNALKLQFTQFLSVLSRFATSADDPLISAINTLVSRFSAVSAAVEKRDAGLILASLGLNA
jgi:hypothetical protein